MTKPALSVRGVGKRYRIGEAQARQDTLVDTVQSWLKSPLQNLRRIRSLRRFDHVDDDTTLWALRDIDFTVQPGEIVGIVGRNGAGKSTLLKVLSRVTEPTVGDITIRGRMGALLEVGTGFHPELTGRENVYLNGTILGMRKTEVDKQFDEIVDFSDISKFIDTPVKFYSSGMMVRLGFAVAAHLEPEILVIDEVLAVGDVAFQSKCLGKMEEVTQQGRTILFVSHNMESVRRLCPRSILLDGGKAVMDGNTPDIISQYLESMADFKIDETTAQKSTMLRKGTGAVRFSDVQVLDRDGRAARSFKCGEPVVFRLRYKTFKHIDLFSVKVGLKRLGARDFVVLTTPHLVRQDVSADAEGELVVRLHDLPLCSGHYSTYLWFGGDDRENYDILDNMTPPIYFEESTDLAQEGIVQVEVSVDHVG